MPRRDLPFHARPLSLLAGEASLILVLSGLALAAAAFSPTFSVLIAALGCVGFTAVAAQLLTPLAGELAAPEHRGRVVGTMASGGLIGILLSRAVSGLVADLLGWRAIYLIAAITALILAGVQRAIFPHLGPGDRISYPHLIGSVFTTIAQHRAAPPTMAISAASFTPSSPSLPGPARSRLNTAVVVSNFLGGAIGSALAGPLWAAGGWSAIVTAALAIVAIGLIILVGFRSWLADQDGPRRLLLMRR